MERYHMGEFEEESQSDKLARKTRENPYVPIGCAGLIATCIYGAYKFKHRGNVPAALFIVQLRVAAQACVVGSLTLGLAWSMFDEYILKNKNTLQDNNKND